MSRALGALGDWAITHPLHSDDGDLGLIDAEAEVWERAYEFSQEWSRAWEDLAFEHGRDPLIEPFNPRWYVVLDEWGVLDHLGLAPDEIRLWKGRDLATNPSAPLDAHPTIRTHRDDLSGLADAPVKFVAAPARYGRRPPVGIAPAGELDPMAPNRGHPRRRHEGP